LVLAIPAVALLIALAFEVLLQSAGQIVTLSPRVCALITALVFVPVMLQGVYFYFWNYVPGNYLSRADVNTEAGHEIGLYLQDLGPGYQTYFSGPPRMEYGFPSIPYLSRNPKGQNLDPGLTPSTVPAIAPGSNAVFVALPERRRDLEVVRSVYPGGQWREFQRRSDPSEPLFLAYEVPNATRQAAG
jgi:hypothetical protein